MHKIEHSKPAKKVERKGIAAAQKCATERIRYAAAVERRTAKEWKRHKGGRGNGKAEALKRSKQKQPGGERKKAIPCTFRLK